MLFACSPIHQRRYINMSVADGLLSKPPLPANEACSVKLAVQRLVVGELKKPNA